MGLFDRFKKKISEAISEIKDEFFDENDEQLRNMDDDDDEFIRGLEDDEDNHSGGLLSTFSSLKTGLESLKGGDSSQLIAGMNSLLGKLFSKGASSLQGESASTRQTSGSSSSHTSAQPQEASISASARPSGSNHLDLSSVLNLKTKPVTPTRRSASTSADSRPMVMTSNVVLAIMKAFYPDAKIDEDDDVVVKLEPPTRKRCFRSIFVTTSPDKLSFGLTLLYTEPTNSIDHAAEALVHYYPDVETVGSNDSMTFLLRQSVKGLSTDDIESIMQESAAIINRLVEASHNFELIEQNFEQSAKPKEAEFSTSLIEKWADAVNADRCATDPDGDVRAEFSKADDRNIDWFIWFIISPKRLVFDSGASHKYDWMDAQQMCDFINKNMTYLQPVTAKVTNNGSLRLFAEMAIGNQTNMDNLSEQFVDIFCKLRAFFNSLAMQNEEYEESFRRQAQYEHRREEERRRLQEDNHSHRSNSKDDEDEVEEENNRNGSSSASGQSLFGNRDSEQERQSRIATLDSKIERHESLIRDRELVLKDWLSNSSPQRKREIADQIAAQRNNIAQFKKELAEMKAERRKLKKS